MRIILAADYQDMSRRAAGLIAAQVAQKPTSLLGLATGSSPLGIYRQLVAWHREEGLDFSRCRTVNLDEYVGLTPDSPQSYAYFMQQNLFDHVNLDPRNLHIPQGDCADPLEECRRYDRLLTQLGPIDLQLLGIGLNGHIGFNEPGESLNADTHCVALSQSTMDANARFFDPGQQMPTHAYTMGLGAIMTAKRVLLIASGAAKADILREMICGKVTTAVPASLLQLHRNVTVVADREALSRLPAELLE